MINYIEKLVATPQGVSIRYHLISGIRSMRKVHSAPVFVATIQSWSTLEGMMSDDTPVDATQYRLASGSVGALDDDLYIRVMEAIVADPSHRLSGGFVVIADPDATALQAAQESKWRDIKTARSAAIDADLTTPFGVMQCKSEDRQNITDAVLLAQTMAALGQTVAIDWTLADNSVVTLSAADMVTVGLLLGQKVQAAHATARTLRATIDAATTVEEVAAVVWPQ